MLTIRFLHPQATPEHLGALPGFLDPADPRPAREQFQARYQWGGWSPTPGWRMRADGVLQYPGDDPLPVLAETILGTERVLFYPHAWVAIVQPDGAFEVARLD